MMEYAWKLQPNWWRKNDEKWTSYVMLFHAISTYLIFLFGGTVPPGFTAPGTMPAPGMPCGVQMGSWPPAMPGVGTDAAGHAWYDTSHALHGAIRADGPGHAHGNGHASGHAGNGHAGNGHAWYGHGSHADGKHAASRTPSRTPSTPTRTRFANERQPRPSAQNSDPSFSVFCIFLSMFFPFLMFLPFLLTNFPRKPSVLQVGLLWRQHWANLHLQHLLQHLQQLQLHPPGRMQHCKQRWPV